MSKEIRIPMDVIRLARSCGFCGIGELAMERQLSGEEYLHMCDNELCGRSEILDVAYPRIIYEERKQ